MDLRLHKVGLKDKKLHGDCPIFANSQTAAVLEYLEGLFWGLTWWSDWKVCKTDFWPKLWPKVQKLFKSRISRTNGRGKLIYPLKWLQGMIYFGWSKMFFYICSLMVILSELHTDIDV